MVTAIALIVIYRVIALFFIYVYVSLMLIFVVFLLHATKIQSYEIKIKPSGNTYFYLCNVKRTKA